MSDRKTRSEFAIWLELFIELHHEGNNAAAGRAWDESRGNIQAVLNTRIKPTDKILAAVGYARKETELYEKVKS